jgi:hypothetical protein
MVRDAAIPPCIDSPGLASHPQSRLQDKARTPSHFFEGTAEFVSIILLSAFSSNEALFGQHRQNLAEAMQKQNLSFQRATFGTWKLVVEYLGKRNTRPARSKRKKTEDAENDSALCADIFAAPSLDLPQSLSRKELAVILSTTNKMRNDWSGHGGVVGQRKPDSETSNSWPKSKNYGRPWLIYGRTHS